MIQLIANILNTHLSGKMCFSNHMNAGLCISDWLPLMDLYQERVPLYEKYADITVDEGHRGPGPVVDELRALMEQRIAEGLQAR